ncbi:MAG: anti-sigma F factor [Oscillospiraceae bacterium]|jgi:stage II sporulation protein AB (anti-sigma F factor)|nr:anti-sigma F factor [Oscillospiraceae bacterium]
MKLEFVARSSNEAFARGAIASFVLQLDPTISELSDIKTAVSEAVTNSIVHGYGEVLGTIYLEAKIFETGKIIIRIRDKGVGIPDVSQAMEPLFTTGGEERSGLGFAVMQSFMDGVKVFSKPGRGTTVTLEKNVIRRFVKEKKQSAVVG